MRVLVDTSVWIDHFARGHQRLETLLINHQALMHPLVIGELACGNLRHRDRVIRFLQELPVAPIATHDEVMAFIARRETYGRGVGYIDVCLLASAALRPDTLLWSADKRLATLAEHINMGYPLH